MKGSYCYVPVLPARGGAFRALAAISPIVRSRLTPLFNVPAAVLKAGSTLESYFIRRVDGIRWCWEPSRPFYVDVHDLDPALRTTGGGQPVEFLIDRLRQYGLSGVPVTGTERDRGADYLDGVGRIIRRYGCGVALRFARDELEEPRLLEQLTYRALDRLCVRPEECDAILDFGYVGADRVENVRATTLDALSVISQVGEFRNFVLLGSSIPAQLGKGDQGIVRREKRVELEAWFSVNRALVDGAASLPLVFGDYAIVGPHYVPPAKIVRVPSRIRYTTASEHVFRRANRSEYRELCKQLIATSDYLGRSFSDGDRRMDLSARGLTGPGAPALWVAYDTNHHLEFVAQQAWQSLRALNLDRRLSLPVPLRAPWLQPELLIE